MASSGALGSFAKVLSKTLDDDDCNEDAAPWIEEECSPLPDHASDAEEGEAAAGEAEEEEVPEKATEGDEAAEEEETVDMDVHQDDDGDDAAVVLKPNEKFLSWPGAKRMTTLEELARLREAADWGRFQKGEYGLMSKGSLKRFKGKGKGKSKGKGKGKRPKTIGKAEWKKAPFKTPQHQWKKENAFAGKEAAVKMGNKKEPVIHIADDMVSKPLPVKEVEKTEPVPVKQVEQNKPNHAKDNGSGQDAEATHACWPTTAASWATTAASSAEAA